MRIFEQRFFAGIGFAATIYLVSLALGHATKAPTLLEVFLVLFTGGLIGLCSLVFELDLSYLVALGLHFCLTVLLVSGLIWSAGWSFSYQTFGMIGAIYLGVWLFLRLTQRKELAQINQKLKEK